MMNVPATLLSAVVTIVIILMYFWMSIGVAQARGKTGIDAPATTGHPHLERAMRVHYNTLEQMPIILPLLWLATIYFHLLPWLPAAVGVVWIVGRLVYQRGYMADPAKRSMGFLIGSVATLVLLVLSVWGVIETWMASSGAGA
ncbi:MAG TPA: MAPEG family protein [Hyphomonadaceae bacterium]|nr:MAPEG family protein [Hyphomonadaceae bacterium]